jgi:hypothetical protein
VPVTTVVCHHRGMLVADAEKAYRAFLLARGAGADDVGAPDAVAAMIDWYAIERATDAASLEDDGDMLLFQWGSRDWGQDRFFEVDITRQLVLASEIDDDAIMQMSFTFRYAPGPATEPLGKGHQWCYGPTDVESLRAFVMGHPATQFMAAATPAQRELRLENAG